MPDVPNTLAGGFARLDPHQRELRPHLDSPVQPQAGGIAMSDRRSQQVGAKPRARRRSGSEKREKNCIVKFRARKDERDEMRANAAAAGLSLGSFLRGLEIARPRTRPVRRPRPDTKIFAQAMGRLGIYAS